MRPLASSLLILLTFCCHWQTSHADDRYTPGVVGDYDFKKDAHAFLQANCFDCHDDATKEAGLDLSSLGPVDELNLGTWKSIWTKVALKEMPPKDYEQPSVVQRLQFIDWTVAEMSRAMEDKGGFRDIHDPRKANYVDHELLFGPLPDTVRLVPTSSPARVWRITPSEHLTRLNEFVNPEPAYDPDFPGRRTHGDAVPEDHAGQLKLYLGLDRLLRKSGGGPGAFYASIKGLPSPLSSQTDIGLKDYAGLESVNSAEVAQIYAMAKDVLRYAAYGPVTLVASPDQITDDPTEYDKNRAIQGNDLGALASVIYSTKVVRPLSPVHDLFQRATYSDADLKAAIAYVFEQVTLRPASEKELQWYLTTTRDSMSKVGSEEGAFMGLALIFLNCDALFRPELVQSGRPDEHGRVMLQDWELGLAVNHSLRYTKPDAKLKAAIETGRMKTRADVKREITRMLEDDSIRKPRVISFFRNFFDYDIAGHICKDLPALLEAGGVAKKTAGKHRRAMVHSLSGTDRLIELILEKDQDVLKQLLTTDKFVARETFDKIYLGRRYEPLEAEKAAVADAARVANGYAKKALSLARLRRSEYQYKLAQSRGEQVEKSSKMFAQRGLARMRVPELGMLADEAEAASKDAKKHAERANAASLQAEQADSIKAVRESLTLAESACANAHEAFMIATRPDTHKKALELYPPLVEPAKLEGGEILARVSRRTYGRESTSENRILTTVPKEQRLGILTHPSWLVSHSDAMDNHAIHRGIWIRERLLGGGIPDVPITVDAQLPDEPAETLRHRMRVTQQEYCWNCHKKMDPLGLPFEMFNHAGIYRTVEKGKPVDASGEIIDSGDPELDGPVGNAIEMIERLAQSERVEQVFVRHAFRFWMGRNETLHDAPVLKEAHRAYRNGGGSMKALITSLVTSDALLYRQHN